MNRILGAAIAALAAVVVAVAVYFAFIRNDAEEAFELSDTSSETTVAADSSTLEPDTSGTEDAGPIETIDGTWTVASGSEAGYRVVEDLGSLADFEATGRTDEVSGSIEIEGSTVTDGSFEVQVASITSDDNRRDNAFTGRIMSAGEFPTAILALTAPVDFGSVPEINSAISATGEGELTLRGVTNAVTIPIQAQLLGDQIEIVASVDVLFSDYGIDNPSNPIVSVRDEGKVEVRLLLTKG